MWCPGGGTRSPWQADGGHGGASCGVPAVSRFASWPPLSCLRLSSLCLLALVGEGAAQADGGHGGCSRTGEQESALAGLGKAVDGRVVLHLCAVAVKAGDEVVAGEGGGAVVYGRLERERAGDVVVGRGRDFLDDVFAVTEAGEGGLTLRVGGEHSGVSLAGGVLPCAAGLLEPCAVLLLDLELGALQLRAGGHGIDLGQVEVVRLDGAGVLARGQVDAVAVLAGGLRVVGGGLLGGLGPVGEGQGLLAVAQQPGQVDGEGVLGLVELRVDCGAVRADRGGDGAIVGAAGQLVGEGVGGDVGLRGQGHVHGVGDVAADAHGVVVLAVDLLVDAHGRVLHGYGAQRGAVLHGGGGLVAGLDLGADEDGQTLAVGDEIPALGDVERGGGAVAVGCGGLGQAGLGEGVGERLDLGCVRTRGSVDRVLPVGDLDVCCLRGIGDLVLDVRFGGHAGLGLAVRDGHVVEAGELVGGEVVAGHVAVDRDGGVIVRNLACIRGHDASRDCSADKHGGNCGH